MTLHKLTAGTGYEYVTRNTAAMDSTEKGHTSLADYYSLKGEKPGHWVGSGLAGIDGLEAGDVVTADQMLSLFGLGDHPLAAERLAALELGATDRDLRDAMQFGQRFGVYPGMTDFSVELTKRIGDWNLAHGRVQSDPVPAEVRAELRTEVGREAFRKRFGREPLDARELSGFIVRASRPVRSGVSGYDATFSPVKSVSALWALADPEVSAVVERCHDRAVADSLRYLEDRAIYTRRDATASDRSRPSGSSPRPSPTATPGPAIPTCTLTSRSRTRCRPRTTVPGWRSTAGSCSRPT